jgi:hypothetical protein
MFKSDCVIDMQKDADFSAVQMSKVDTMVLQIAFSLSSESESTSTYLRVKYLSPNNRYFNLGIDAEDWDIKCEM